MNKKAGLALLLFIATNLPQRAIDLGLIAGPLENPSVFLFGISANFGLIVPLLKMELEACQPSSAGPEHYLSLAAKIKPSWGKISPYFAIGLGLRFERLNFEFDQYRGYTFLAGGCHLKMNAKLSLRFDVRFLQFSQDSRTRYSGGLFLHL